MVVGQYLQMCSIFGIEHMSCAIEQMISYMMFWLSTIISNICLILFGHRRTKAFKNRNMLFFLFAQTYILFSLFCHLFDHFPVKASNCNERIENGSGLLMANKCRGSFLLESNILMNAFTETKTKKKRRNGKRERKKKMRKRKIQRYHNSAFTVRASDLTTVPFCLCVSVRV